MEDTKIEKVTQGNNKKRAMIEALNKTLGIVTTACIKVGINPKTHYQWLKEDPQYKSDVLAIGDTAIDFVESNLFKKIKSGDTTACIFYLKTKGKNRGYIEKLEVDNHTYNHESIFDKIEPAPNE